MTRRARMLLCAAVLAVGVAQVGSAFAQSLIPLAMHGRVEETGYVSGTALRVRTVTIGGRTYQTDNLSVAELDEGDVVDKPAWSTRLTVDDDRSIRLVVGDEPFQFGALTLLAVAAAWRLSGHRSRFDRRWATSAADAGDTVT